MSCASLRARASNTLVSVATARGAILIEFVGKIELVSALRFGLEPGTRAAIAPRRSRISPNCGGEFGVVDAHQRLILLDDRAFLHQEIGDDAAFERLHHLGLARRHDPAVAALDLVEHREMRPDQERRRAGRAKRTAACARSAACAARPRRGCHWRRRNQIAPLASPHRAAPRTAARRSLASTWSRGTVGDQPAVVEHQQAIDQRQQRQPMGRDDDGHLAVRQRLQPLEEFGLAADVEMRGRLVQEQDARLADQDARQPDRLLLAAGQAAAALGDRHVVAQRMTGDEALDAGQPRGLDHLLVGRAGVPSVMLSRSLPKNRSVSCSTKPMPVAQVGRIVLPDVDAVDQDAAVARLVEADQQPADRGLAGSDPADDADPLARP